MVAAEDPRRARHARWVAWAVTLLLFVRFSASTALIGVNLSPPTLVTVGGVLEAYEVLLAFVLIPVFFIVLGWRPTAVPIRTTLAVLALTGAALVTWLLAVLEVLVPLTTLTFLVLAIAAVAAGSWLAYPFPKARREAMQRWTRVVHAVVLVALPVVFAVRVAALEGLDPVIGSGGWMRANWFFVNLPTVILEFLVIAVFLNVVLDRSGAELRARWYAFLPFVLVPLIMDGVSDRPLTGYVLSALITWGSNLALFAPAVVSLGVVSAVFACFASALLLLGRRGNAVAWELLLLGCASALFAGFYPSMASVAGLNVSMLLIARAIGEWPRRAGSAQAAAGSPESAP
ncbi:MAG TPA: hypothetical protein VEY12_12350 [Thermoplasmata archaeon]|nr:hypothetical protein [Thermoplasmata archaeon]